MPSSWMVNQRWRYETFMNPHFSWLMADAFGVAYNNIATIHHQRSKKLASTGDATASAVQLDVAIGWYLEAIDRYSGYEEIYQNLADAFVEKGDLVKAVDLFERALEIDARRAGTWNNYGQTLVLAERDDEAEKAFLKAVELTPATAEPYNNLANLFDRGGKYEKATEYYHEALRRDPRRKADVLGNLADTYRKLGEFGLARKSLNSALELEPHGPMLQLYLGDLHRDTGERADAISVYDRAVRLDKSLVRAHVESGELLADSGRHEDALIRFRKALIARADYGRALFAMGRSLDKLERHGEAMESYRGFLAVWPHRDRRHESVRLRIRQLEEIEIQSGVEGR